jgi:hypothetical protein
LWFHFQVRQPGGDHLRCDQVIDEHYFGEVAADTIRPVYRRAGEEWERVSASEFDRDRRVLRFVVPCRGRDTEVAHCYPYQPADWERFFRERLEPVGARRLCLGRSARGRPLEAAQAGEGPTRVLLTARVHAGETPGSYTLEGLIGRLITEGAGEVSLRIIPFVDLDGVVEGRYGKNAYPVDFGRGWDGSNPRPEVAAYRDYVAAEPPHLAVDCHAPLALHPHFLSHTMLPEAPGNFRAQMRRLVEAVTAACGASPATALDPAMTGEHHDWYEPHGFAGSLAGYLQARYATLALVVESAYHRSTAGVLLTPSDWRALGEAVGAGMLAWLRGEAQ